MRKPDRPKASQIFRCAIYTRKSSDDGLKQEFNSLDAQRDAGEAYVPDGLRSPKCMTTGASRAARWSARPCSGSSLRNQHINLPQLGDDLLRLVVLSPHLQSSSHAQKHSSGWTTSVGVDQGVTAGARRRAGRAVIVT